MSSWEANYKTSVAKAVWHYYKQGQTRRLLAQSQVETATMYLDTGVIVDVCRLRITCLNYLRPLLVPLFEFELGWSWDWASCTAGCFLFSFF